MGGSSSWRRTTTTWKGTLSVSSLSGASMVAQTSLDPGTARAQASTWKVARQQADRLQTKDSVAASLRVSFVSTWSMMYALGSFTRCLLQEECQLSVALAPCTSSTTTTPLLQMESSKRALMASSRPV